jgi:hypothetical protein
MCYPSNSDDTLIAVFSSLHYAKPNHVTPCEAKAGFHMESLVGLLLLLLLLEKLRLGQTSSLKMAQCFTSYYGVFRPF